MASPRSEQNHAPVRRHQNDHRYEAIGADGNCRPRPTPLGERFAIIHVDEFRSVGQLSQAPMAVKRRASGTLALAPSSDRPDRAAVAPRHSHTSRQVIDPIRRLMQLIASKKARVNWKLNQVNIVDIAQNHPWDSYYSFRYVTNST